jgi:hypothetical protein
MESAPLTTRAFVTGCQPARLIARRIGTYFLKTGRSRLYKVAFEKYLRKPAAEWYIRMFT